MIFVGNIYAGLGGGGTVTGADNGLNLNGANVELGGTLNGSTSIDVSAGALTFDGSIGPVFSEYEFSPVFLQFVVGNATSESSLAIGPGGLALGFTRLSDNKTKSIGLSLSAGIAVVDQIDQINSGTLPIVVASIQFGLSSASSTILSYSIPAGSNRQFRINMFLLTLAGITGSISAAYTFTNSQGNADGGIFTPMGLTVPGITTARSSNYAPAIINAQAGSTITITTTVAGAVTYDSTASIEQIF